MTEPMTLEQARDWLRENPPQYESSDPGVMAVIAAIDAHLAQQAQAETSTRMSALNDTARLDYLALHPRAAEVHIGGVPTPCIFWGVSAAPEVTLREAIDRVRFASPPSPEREDNDGAHRD